MIEIHCTAVTQCGTALICLSVKTWKWFWKNQQKHTYRVVSWTRWRASNHNTWRQVSGFVDVDKKVSTILWCDRWMPINKRSMMFIWLLVFSSVCFGSLSIPVPLSLRSNRCRSSHVFLFSTNWSIFFGFLCVYTPIIYAVQIFLSVLSAAYSAIEYSSQKRYEKKIHHTESTTDIFKSLLVFVLIRHETDHNEYCEIITKCRVWENRNENDCLFLFVENLKTKKSISKEIRRNFEIQMEFIQLISDTCLLD